MGILVKLKSAIGNTEPLLNVKFDISYRKLELDFKIVGSIIYLVTRCLYAKCNKTQTVTINK